MSLRSLSLYGLDRPRWYVRLRGLGWLRYGCCPCCYSSPPKPECPICAGDYEYGPKITTQRSAQWRSAWLARCEAYRRRR